MLPEIWGKHLWFSIHFIAQDYPEAPSLEDAKAYKDFFENLWKVIPCYKCGVNYKRHLQEMPIDEYLKSRETLFAWTVGLHNIVNKELGKPTMSLDDAKRFYTNPEFNTAQCKTVITMFKESDTTAGSSSSWKPLILVVISVLLLVIMFLVAFNKKAIPRKLK